MAFSAHTIKVLFARSGNRCAHPVCDAELVAAASAEDPDAVIGQIAHIVAQSDNGPRADPSLSANERDLAQNLVLLCPTHHRVADSQENTYSIDDMARWKREHEALVESQMQALASNLTFIELEVVAHHVAITPGPASTSFELLTVQEKLTYNDLAAATERDLRIGMLGADVAREYIAQNALIDPDFPERLRAGFVSEYQALVRRGLAGDELFVALREFASPGWQGLQRQVAGLAVLTHLFRICEVFES